MNNQDKILLAFAAAQAMKTFSESCKNSGIKVSREVIIETWNKVSETLWVPKNQIAEIGTMIEVWKHQNEIQSIIAQKYYPDVQNHIDIQTPYNSQINISQQRKIILNIIEQIKEEYMREELKNKENHGLDLIQIHEIWEKKAWKHIRKILKFSLEANDHIDNTNAHSNLNIQLAIESIKFDKPITKNDVELYYYYAKYLAQKKGK